MALTKITSDVTGVFDLQDEDNAETASISAKRAASSFVNKASMPPTDSKLSEKPM